MKKMFFAAVLLTVAFAVSAQNGVIRELTGDVEIKSAGASAFVPAKQGDEIAQNTIVSTGFKSTAIVAVGSSVITVRPLTRLTLAEISSSSGTENLNVNLQTGRVKVDVKPPAGSKANCTVQGPSATASVRGTSFEFDGQNLSVSEGTVAFAGNSGAPATMVSGGGSSFVGVDGKPANPADVSNADLTPPVPVGTPDTPSTPPQASNGDLDISLDY
ncbi:MAG: FecR family protein [Treponema sp.]|jgi:hypothetical protein|nr:FecR family protein [Treponema sp.]